MTNWAVSLLVATIPAIAAIGAAVLAARSARSSRQAELDAARIRNLEERLADRKYAVYEPMIEMLGQVLGPNSTAGSPIDSSKISSFATWIGIFGSDEALRAFRNFMQGAFASAPGPIAMRLYAEFLLAARRDMGDRDSSVTANEVLGLRIKDLYDSPTGRSALMPFDELCREEGWLPPWLQQTFADDSTEVRGARNA